MSPSPPAAPPTYALLYRSVASDGLTVGDVLHIFADSKQRNASRDVTGLLLYTGVSLGPSEPVSADAPPEASASSGRVDRFLQWLEGPEPAVRALYDRILQDPRHHSCERLAEGPLAELTGRDERLFPTWSMRFGEVPALPVSVSGLRRAADRMRQGRHGEPSAPPPASVQR